MRHGIGHDATMPSLHKGINKTKAMKTQTLSVSPTIQVPSPAVRTRSAKKIIRHDRRFPQFDTEIEFHQKVEEVCFGILGLSGIGTIFYSASIFTR
jgi:hypothetical protein